MAFYTWVGKNRDEMMVREVRDGKRQKFEVKYEPTMYVPAPADYEESDMWRTLSGESVIPRTFVSMGACRKYIHEMKEMENSVLYGNDQFQYAYIAENYPGHIEYDPQQIVIANCDIEVGARTSFRAALDTVNTPEEIISATIKASNEAKFRVFGTKPYMPSDEVDYIQCDDEGDLLEHLIAAWEEIDPDAMTGWNIIGYDIPYLYNRITKRLDKKRANRLSPFGHVHQVTHKRFDKEFISYAIAGVNILDYQQLYRKNVLEPLEAYTLDFVAEVELGEKKLDYSEYRNLWELYQRNHQKFIEYNIHDVRLVDRIEAKKRIIELQQIVAYRSKVNMEDVMSQVRTWDAAIFNYLRERKIVVPMREVDDKDTQYEGAYVKEPEPKLHRWIVSFDVNSLYPSLIAALNIGIETKRQRTDWSSQQRREVDRMSSALMLDRLPNWELFDGLDISMAANGATYDRSTPSVFTLMIVDLLSARKEYRKIAEDAAVALHEMKSKLEADPTNAELLAEQDRLTYVESNFSLKEKMTKVLNNSLYGCVGNEYFRFYDTENAEAITVSGQFVIQYVARELNATLNRKLGTGNVDYVVYIDTDSNYITLDEVVKKFLPNETDPLKIVAYLDRVSKNILEPEINRIFAEIRDMFFHGNGDFLAMKREIIADKGIWTKKKRYALNVYDDGKRRFTKPKLKYMGLEMKRSTTPKLCREAMMRCCEIIFNGTQQELYDYVRQFSDEYFAAPLIKIAFPKGVNGLDTYADEANIAKSGSPQHVRASLLYNFLLESKGLQSVYPPIMEGEKIKYVYLQRFNPSGHTAIAFHDILPPELNLEKYVDREEMYNKGFLDPMKRIADAADWKLEWRPDIESLFC